MGVNGYVEDDGVAPSTLGIDPARRGGAARAAGPVKQARDDDAVRRALARLAADAADPGVNLMPALIEAAHAMVTVGEAMGALESVFGIYIERQVA